MSMQSTATPSFLEWQDNAQPPKLILRGDWLLSNYNGLSKQIAQLRQRTEASRLAGAQIDVGEMAALDTAGAMQLISLLGKDAVQQWLASGGETNEGRQALLKAVLEAEAEIPVTKETPIPRWQVVLGEIGDSVVATARQAIDLLGFIGLTLQVLMRCLLSPWRWRPTAVVAQLDQAGFRAVPIVVMLTFMVGAVVAFLGATILKSFGATIYTVDLIGFSFLREFAVLLTAILIAGRTASAYTAQLGLMKVNEEIDALRMTGVDPVELLVIPRVVALLVALPLLTFIGMVSGILGGMMVSALSLDISPSMFISILQQDIAVKNFILGMVKAPIFAFLIAVIGCSEGFKVAGSAQSVGTRTTSSVVQSIFVVILLDAVAALFYMEMGW